MKLSFHTQEKQFTFRVADNFSKSTSPDIELTLTCRLRMIAESEDVDVNDDAVDALLDFSEGDMRKSITFLQVCMLVK